jgi:hypothetical protein
VRDHFIGHDSTSSSVVRVGLPTGFPFKPLWSIFTGDVGRRPDVEQATRRFHAGRERLAPRQGPWHARQRGEQGRG